MSDPAFWDNPDEAQKIAQEVTRLKDSIGQYRDMADRHSDMAVLWQLGMEENDESVYPEVAAALTALERDMEHLELTLMLSGEYDANNAILTLHAGAGGTEAQDWAQMLLRMYVRWAEKNNYKLETMDFLAGDEAGVKSVTIMVAGTNAYGYLKSEKGVHRLVRISPFDTSGRRHTSFAAVDVMPEIDDSVQIDINPADLRVDTFRAGGAGGQHINKTDSAVRMTHLPTGVVVQCQSERSQIQNREQCMRLLRARLFELERQKQADKKAELGGEYQAIEWGSQIRSYVFHPYNLVKDHRTAAETGNVQAVMDGEIELFIEAYLKSGTR
ncbi:Peptide chain release factor 2 [Sporomusa paucivorans]|jgi:peptide chain release factor 2|uniref:Peptide chain release factor 2 n=2 Tax=Sporomusaceae TaxID=1843490 RepID=A0ABM9W526_9FIRM|nr:peptide chain release factor 2 [Sporomusa sphaeroides DSM 2875]CVK19478.1 Peptide chain release factor 2 [Sporomusa sphaeroides DSM 2875]